MKFDIRIETEPGAPDEPIPDHWGLIVTFWCISCGKSFRINHIVETDTPLGELKPLLEVAFQHAKLPGQLHHEGCQGETRPCEMAAG